MAIAHDPAFVMRFLEDFHARVFHWTFSYQDRMWDWRRFGPEPKRSRLGRIKHRSFLGGIKHRARLIAAKKGVVSRLFDASVASRELALVARHQEAYARAYSILDDEYSRQTYLDVLAYRALGGHHVRMPVNTPEWWTHYDNDDQLVAKRHTIVTSWGWTMNQYDIKGRSGPISLNMPPAGYLYLFLTRCYDYNKRGRVIRVQPNDVVIDGGGCWCDTAVLFADEVAPEGRVFSFEFVPENLRIARANIDLNPRVKPRIEIVEHALGERSGQTLAFSPNGPATHVSRGEGLDQAPRVTTISVDDFVSDRQLSTVDFVKMDIEGSEMAALRGAVQTLRRFKPRLAISLYHEPQDLHEIPLFIHDLGLGYKCFLDHFTVHREETVLFATCEA
jgi:FkbM family methyltransferase